MAYVEFYLPESITKALALNKKKFMGHQIQIQPAQAEKNRGHLVTR
jgi:hypothetical protein